MAYTRCFAPEIDLLAANPVADCTSAASESAVLLLPPFYNDHSTRPLSMSRRICRGAVTISSTQTKATRKLVVVLDRHSISADVTVQSCKEVGSASCC
jgi:hypothetical protein